MIWNNRKLLIFVLFISSLFYSCQKKDPFDFLSSNSISIGYINNPSKYGLSSLNIDNLTGKSVDTSNFFNKNVPGLLNKPEYEVYYSHLDKNNYTFVIECKGLGEEIRKKMRVEKEIPNFEFKEIYIEGLLFITPFDNDLVICSSQMDDIKAAVRRSEKNSIVANPFFRATEKRFMESSANWFITFDTLQIRKILYPLHIDINDSFFLKYLMLFNDLIFSKLNSGGSLIEIQSKQVEDNKISQVESEFNIFKNNSDIKRIAQNYPYFNFSVIKFNKNNKTFKITIE
jgi:hypothetical protein